jgi:hypothetical protein
MGGGLCVLNERRGVRNMVFDVETVGIFDGSSTKI